MSKVKKHKVLKSHLSAEEKQLGKMHIYVLIGIIVVGLAFGLYYMQ
ncbi:MAG: hypothetical protein KBD76_11415 [Bacteriovorax sp.]|nr:hypothetical protein [Bacteriovorax sp.]